MPACNFRFVFCAQRPLFAVHPITDWEVTELIPDFDAFQIAFKTRAELGRYRVTSPDVTPLNDEAKTKPLDELEVWQDGANLKCRRLLSDWRAASTSPHICCILTKSWTASRNRSELARCWCGNL
jgi:hypothetical protein